MSSLLTKPSHILHLTKFCCSRQLHFGKRLVGHSKIGRWFAIPARILSVLAGSGLLAGVVVSHVFSDDGPAELDGAVPGEKKTKLTATPRGLPEPHSTETKTFRQAVTESRDLLQRVKDETGTPGLVIGVSVDGQLVWTEGLGYSDVENRVAMSADSVLRIASISKSITMAIVAKLWEAGKLDLDAPVQKYVPDFPEKVVDGEKVTITTRQLVSHLSGIRHYEKQPKKKGPKDKENNKSSKDEKNKAAKEEDNKDIVKERAEGDSKFKEFYLKRKFSSVTESLKLFQDDPLIHKPGSEFLYTTHGWTLVSAVVEGASGETFPKLLAGLFLDLGLNNTFMDQNDPLIYHRGRNYVKNPKGRLVNAPYVDNSYKWAGGGLLSTVGDLLKFGNAMLYSYQHCVENTNIHGECQNAKESSQKSKPSVNVENKKSHSSRALGKASKKINGLPGYLKPETVKEMWTLVKNTECSWDKSGGYGMGWAVVPEKREHGCCAHRKYYVSHTGGAMGASSVLLIYPLMLERLDQGQISEGHSKVQGQGHSSERRNLEKRNENTVSLGDRSLMKDLARGQGQTFCSKSLPQGISVAIIANTSSVGLNKTALKVAQIFEQTNL